MADPRRLDIEAYSGSRAVTVDFGRGGKTILSITVTVDEADVATVHAVVKERAHIVAKIDPTCGLIVPGCWAVPEKLPLGS